MKKDILKRKGIVVVSGHLLHDHRGVKSISLVMNKVVVVNVIHNLLTNVMIYYCLSDHFEVIEDGEVPPVYDVVFTYSLGKRTKIKFTKTDVPLAEYGQF